mmetsp:Transcript_176611/g.566302  ORF Transcript_176611/g.566302 Transcript_176611/m.566302 type:complete len:545 (-) Transcript_176611:15-1649(-)
MGNCSLRSSRSCMHPSQQGLVEETCAHGIARISKDPTVSGLTLRLIALVRSLVLLLLLAGAAAALYPLWPLQIRETYTESKIELVLDYCGPEGPTITNENTDSSGLLDVLKRKAIKVVSFKATGEESKQLGLPHLTFFQSEEFHATTRERSMGFSFGSFKVNEMHFHVKVNRTFAQAQSCIKGSSSAQHSPKAGEAGAVELFGKAMVNLLAEAGRRKPQRWLMTVPAAHGAILIWRGPETVWSQTYSRFEDVYVPSPAWRAYQLVFNLCRCGFAIVSILVFGKLCHREWEKTVDIWVLQYDYLWEEHTTAEASKAQGDETVGPKARGGEDAVGIGATFEHRYQACSVIFILDHVVGDPQTNSEQWRTGILSAVVQGLVSVLMCALPVLQAMFFQNWKLLCWFLVSLHLGVSFVFFCAYYFAVPWRFRACFFYSHAITSFALLVYSTLYFWNVVLFMATRLIVDPTEVSGYAVAMGTVIIVATVAFSQLIKLRSGILDKQKSGSSSIGETIRFLKTAGKHGQGRGQRRGCDREYCVSSAEDARAH